MFRISTALVLIAIALLGLLRILRAKASLSEREEFAHEYLDRLREFFESNGADSNSYTWLTHRANRMQEDLGANGVLAAYRPPFANFQYKNYPIVLNMLPDLRNAITDATLSRGDLPRQYVMTLNDAIVRHLGILDDSLENTQKSAVNPLVWFREGVRFLLASPLHILDWLGLLTTASVSRFERGSVFKVVSGIAGTLGFLSAVMGIALGWEEFLKLTSKLCAWDF